MKQKVNFLLAATVAILYFKRKFVLHDNVNTELYTHVDYEEKNMKLSSVDSMSSCSWWHKVLLLSLQ